MVTPDLTRAISHAAVLVVALTALGAFIALLDPELVASTPPHPSLTGTLDDALSILAANARTLAIPFAFALLRLGRSRPGRLLGDLGVLALVAVSTLNVGLELGRWGARLIPYIPQLPLEWAALALATAAWLIVRQHPAPPSALIIVAVAVAALLISAAAVETWTTPRRHSDQTVDVPHGPAGSRGQMRPAHFADARPVIRPVSPDLGSLAEGARRPWQDHINPRPPGGIT